MKLFDLPLASTLLLAALPLLLACATSGRPPAPEPVSAAPGAAALPPSPGQGRRDRTPSRARTRRPSIT